MYQSLFHMALPWSLLQAMLVALGIPIVFFGSCFLGIWWFDAICPKCYRRAPDFVWSYGTASKARCERCDPNRIKDVFGSNLNYLEAKYVQRDKCKLFRVKRLSIR